MRRHFVGLPVLLALAASTATAQTIRGTIVDDARRQPVTEVITTLVDAGGVEIPPSVRSDTRGGFVLNAAKPGKYRVRATRIGFAPLTSAEITLGPGELAVLQLRMVAVAQQLVPVTVVEKRALTLRELMSKEGFDVRQARQMGHFMNAERLAELGPMGAGEVIRTYMRPPVYLADTVRQCLYSSPCPPTSDSSYVTSSPPYFYMRSGGRNVCSPEIYLDGSQLGQPGDSVSRSQFAYSIIDAIPAQELHGIEAYPGNEVPPPSLGGLMGQSRGMNFDAPLMNSCGVVAVWTKSGNRISGAAPRGPGLSGIQVLRGTVVDFDTGLPRAGVPIRLLDANQDLIAEEVRSDSLGNFTIRTKKIGPVRLQSGDIGRGTFYSPNFTLTAEELVVLKYFVSTTTPVLAPLGFIARMGPDKSAITELGSFAYRRERGIAGTFFGSDDIQRRRASSLAELLVGVTGVVVEGTTPADSIMMRTFPSERAPLCAPSFFLNGSPVVGSVVAATSAIKMDRIFGVEVYVKPTDVPLNHADPNSRCGMVGIWTRDR